MTARSRYWLLLMVGAPGVGLLLLSWATHYSIAWFSPQMLWLIAIMALDRQLFHWWRKLGDHHTARLGRK